MAPHQSWLDWFGIDAKPLQKQCSAFLTIKGAILPWAGGQAEPLKEESCFQNGVASWLLILRMVIHVIGVCWGIAPSNPNLLKGEMTPSLNVDRNSLTCGDPLLRWTWPVMTLWQNGIFGILVHLSVSASLCECILVTSASVHFDHMHSVHTNVYKASCLATFLWQTRSHLRTFPSLWETGLLCTSLNHKR